MADDKGNVFNFERLTMSDDNYQVDGSDAPNGPAKFIINVCTTLVHTKGNCNGKTLRCSNFMIVCLLSGVVGEIV